MASKPEPYIGPRPFNRLEEARFFGRDDEARELLSLIIAHPIVLLYSESGAGKTSLLNAMLVPMLEARNSQVLGPARVGGALPQWIKYRDVKNIYSFNAILTMRGESLNSEKVWSMSFADFMKTQEVVSPERQYSRRVVVFDQIEEMFFTHPERWEDRQVFFSSISDSLENDPSLRIVFVIREEYLAHIDSFAPLLPERLRTRFRLERLRKEAALLAVTMPLKDTGYSFAPGAAEKLVRDLLRVPIKAGSATVEILGEFAEPVQLQVVCKRMWQSLPPNVKEIDESLIENYGNANDALASYYDAGVEKTAKKSNIKEGVLRRWFGQKLITPDRTRGTVYKDAYVESGLNNAAIGILEDLHLIRTEMRGGAPWYELSHDRFIVPILQSNEAWLDRVQGGTSIGQKLEERAQTWAYGSVIRQTKHLLDESEVADAKRWVDRADAEGYVVSDLLLEFIKASQGHIEAGLRRQRNISVAITTIAVASTVAVIVLSILIYKLRDSEEITKRAEEKGLHAGYLSDIPPNEFYSLSLALSAFDVNNPPEEAIKGLRKAITAFGNSTWLRGMEVPTGISGAQLSADSAYTVAYSENEVCVWKTDTGALLVKIMKKAAEEEYVSAELTPDGKRLVTRVSLKLPQAPNDDPNKETKPREYLTEVWDVSNVTNGALWSQAATSKSITLNDHRYLLVFNPAGKPFVLNVETVNGPTPPDRYEINLGALEAEDIEGAVVLPNELQLIVSTDDGSLVVWDLKTGESIRTLLPTSDGYVSFSALHFSLPENRLVFIIRDWQLSERVYKIYTWAPENTELGKPAVFRSDDYSPYTHISADGKRLIILTDIDSQLKVSIWEVATGKEKFINRDSTIKGKWSYWHNEVGLFQYDGDKKQLEFEDYDTGQTSTLLSYPPKYGVIRLADVSPNGFVLASSGNTHLFTRQRGSEPLNVEKYSAEQLKAKACELLRGQREFDLIRSICE